MSCPALGSDSSSFRVRSIGFVRLLEISRIHHYGTARERGLPYKPHGCITIVSNRQEPMEAWKPGYSAAPVFGKRIVCGLAGFSVKSEAAVPVIFQLPRCVRLGAFGVWKRMLHRPSIFRSCHEETSCYRAMDLCLVQDGGSNLSYTRYVNRPDPFHQHACRLGAWLDVPLRSFPDFSGRCSASKLSTRVQHHHRVRRRRRRPRYPGS